MPRPRLLLPLSLLALTVAVVAEAGQSPNTAKDLYGDPLPSGALARIGTLRFRHDGTIVFADFLGDGKSVLSVGNDGTVCVWEFPSGNEIRRFGTTARITSAALSPDGKHLIAFCSDGMLCVWDWADGKEIGKVAAAGKAPATSKIVSSFPGKNVKGVGGPGVGGFAAPAAGTVFSPDGKTLLLTKSGRVLQFVDLATAKEVGPSLGHTAPLIAVEFTADGKHLVTHDTASTHTWAAATGKDLGSTSTIVRLPDNPWYPTIISPDGRFGVKVATFATLAKAKAATVRPAVLFDPATGKQLGEIALEAIYGQIHPRPILFSPDGKILAFNTGNDREKIDLYEVPSGKLLRTLEAGPLANPAAGGKLPAALAGLGNGSQRMLFAPDGKTLAFQAGLQSPIVLLGTVTGNKIGALAPIEGNMAALQGLFTPDGRCLALQMSNDTVTLFELATGQPRHTYSTKLAPAVEIDPFDDPFGPFGGGGFGGAGKGGGFASFATVLTKISLVFALSPDGKLLAFAGLDGTVPVLDVLTGKELIVFKGHTGAVNAVAFAPNGKTLASASADTTALLWDITKIVRPAPTAKTPKAGDLDKWWQALADTDAAKAFAAMGHFAVAPKEAVAWIKVHVPPAPPLDKKRALALIQQLDHDQFKVRDKATAELVKIGELAVPLIDQALAGKTSSESRQRLEELRGKLTGLLLSGERLRAFRAVEVLERIGNAQAREVLQGLAEGAPGALLTTSAQAAFQRQH
jgi:WD40 repeat protein